MPASISSVVSPSCNFKILYCKLCDQSIDDGKDVKCDGCQQIFHNGCIAGHQNQPDKDLIQLCKSCSNVKEVYSPKSKTKSKPKSKLEKSIKTNTSSENSSKRNLRPRANSIDSVNVTKAKSMKNSNHQSNCNAAAIDNIIAQYDAKMKMIETRVNAIENAPCKCANEVNKRLTNIEGSMIEKEVAWDCTSKALKYIENDYGFLEARYYIVEKEMYTLTNIVKGCDAFVETNVTLITEVQKQLHEIQCKINGNTMHDSASNVCVSKDNDIMDQIHNMSLRLNDLKEGQIEIEASNDVCKKALVTLCNAVKCHNNTITTHFDLNIAYAERIIGEVNGDLKEINNVNKNMKKKNNQKKKKSSVLHTHKDDTQNHSTQSIDTTKSTTTHTQVMTSPAEQMNASTNIQTESASQHLRKQHLESNEVASTGHIHKRKSAQTPLNTCTINSQALMYGARSDYRKIKISIKNSVGFKHERDVQGSIGDALVSFSSYFKSESVTMFTNKVKYDPLTQKIVNCTLIVDLPHPIDIVRFDHFTNRFLSKMDFEAGNG